jgi:hypothetical protein
MEAAKAQIWAVEPQGKKAALLLCSFVLHTSYIDFIVLFYIL